MEQIEGSETSTFRTQTPGNYPKENIIQRIFFLRWHNFILLLINCKQHEKAATFQLGSSHFPSRHTLILSFHLLLDLPIEPFPGGFTHKCCAHVSHFPHAYCLPSHLVKSTQYLFWKSALCSFLHLQATSFFLGISREFWKAICLSEWCILHNYQTNFKIS